MVHRSGTNSHVAGRRFGHPESISLLRTGVSLDVSPCLQQGMGGWYMLTHLYQEGLNVGVVWQSCVSRLR